MLKRGEFIINGVNGRVHHQERLKNVTGLDIGTCQAGRGAPTPRPQNTTRTARKTARMEAIPTNSVTHKGLIKDGLVTGGTMGGVHGHCTKTVQSRE